MSKLSFAAWLVAVDRAVQAKVGLSYQDLPDGPFYDWWVDGITPKQAASLLLEQEGF